MLFLAAFTRFFIIGTAMVGLPYIVRNILRLDAAYYGAAESAFAIATIIGSIVAGLLITKLKMRRLSFVLAAAGLFPIPAGIAFLFPIRTITIYIINVISFCGIYIATTIFPIFSVSVIQQRTPTHLTGKIMAYTATITLCMQPLGQIAYGLLVDGFRSAIYFVLIFTGVFAASIGLLATAFFQKPEMDLTAVKWQKIYQQSACHCLYPDFSGNRT